MLWFLQANGKSGEFDCAALNSYGWGISYKGLISPRETPDKAAFQLIFSLTVQMVFPEFVAHQNPIISQYGVYCDLYYLD